MTGAGTGRSAQVSEGNDMDHYADDLADLTEHLDLHDAIHVGHSAGGEMARCIGRHGESRVAKAVLISAVIAADRSEFYRAVPSGPFYNFDQPGVEPSEAVIANATLAAGPGSGPAGAGSPRPARS
jgi:non-heme chloroperoxidase